MPTPPSSPEAGDLFRKLHNTVAQQLTAASMIAHLLTERLRGRGDSESGMAAELAEKLNVTSSQLRDIMRECADPPPPENSSQS